MLGWNYDKHANFSDALLKARSSSALFRLLNSDSVELIKLVCDTRGAHALYFENLTPTRAPYFAGQYRGSLYPRLTFYVVRFGNRFGTYPYMVESHMDAICIQYRENLQKLSGLFATGGLHESQRLYLISELDAAVFVAFLTVHPYADGNGHMSRLIITAIFLVFGYRLAKMPLHPRPITTPPLSDLIEDYRKGNKAPLTIAILNHL